VVLFSGGYSQRAPPAVQLVVLWGRFFRGDNVGYMSSGSAPYVWERWLLLLVALGAKNSMSICAICIWAPYHPYRFPYNPWTCSVLRFCLSKDPGTSRKGRGAKGGAVRKKKSCPRLKTQFLRDRMTKHPRPPETTCHVVLPSEVYGKSEKRLQLVSKVTSV
jgi:hypothetical protein